jgi:hypothetical protein
MSDYAHKRSGEFAIKPKQSGNPVILRNSYRLFEEHFGRNIWPVSSQKSVMSRPNVGKFDQLSFFGTLTGGIDGLPVLPVTVLFL